MNFSALYSVINLGYFLNIYLSLDEFYVLISIYLAFSIDDRGHLFRKTIGISCIILCSNPLHTDKMVFF